MTHATLAAREGVTRGAVTQRLLARGITTRPVTPPWVCELVREAYDDGATLAELHESAGVAVSTLRGWIARAGGRMRAMGMRCSGCSGKPRMLEPLTSGATSTAMMQWRPFAHSPHRRPPMPTDLDLTIAPRACLACGAPVIRLRERRTNRTDAHYRNCGRLTGGVECAECVLGRRLRSGGWMSVMRSVRWRDLTPTRLAHDRTDLRRWLRWRALRGLPT